MLQENTTANLTAEKKPPILLVSIVAVALTVVYSAYLAFTNSSLVSETKRLDESSVALVSQIDALKQENVGPVKSAMEALKTIEATEIRWSQALTDLDSVVPKDRLGDARVTFLTYSGSTDGKLAINGQTSVSKSDPFADIATLISSFNASPLFSDVLVPSITRAENEVNDSFLSFSLNLKYLPSAISSDVTLKTDEVDVPLGNTPVKVTPKIAPEVKVPVKK